MIGHVWRVPRSVLGSQRPQRRARRAGVSYSDGLDVDLELTDEDDGGKGGGRGRRGKVSVAALGRVHKLPRLPGYETAEAGTKGRQKLSQEGGSEKRPGALARKRGAIREDKGEDKGEDASMGAASSGEEEVPMEDDDVVPDSADAGVRVARSGGGGGRGRGRGGVKENGRARKKRRTISDEEDEEEEESTGEVEEGEEGSDWEEEGEEGEEGQGGSDWSEDEDRVQKGRGEKREKGRVLKK